MIGRGEYLLEVGARLWPPGVRVTQKQEANGTRAFLLIPSADQPQLMVPAGAPRAAAAAVAGFTGHRTGRDGWRSRGLRWFLRLGLGDRLLPRRLVVGPEPGVETYLAPILGQSPLLAMHIGPPRANRKPVLQLLDPSGRVLGFAKIGTGGLTDELVDQEARALARLAERPPVGVGVPQLLHRGRWRDLDVLVQAGLPVPGARPPSPSRLTDAMIAVADSGPQETVPLQDCAFLDQLITDLAGLGSPGETLAADLTAVRSAEPDLNVRLGTSHGDWTPWNCALGADGRLLLWDWERYRERVPRGLDALHHRLQCGLGSGTVAPAVATDLLEASPMLLEPFGVIPAEARLIGLLYLADLARRYLQDGQAAAGSRRGDVGGWLVPAVHQQTEQLTEQRS